MTDGNPKRRAAPARLGAPIALLALAAGLAGCAVGPNYVKPDSQVAPQFEGARDGAFSGADAQGKFWTQLGDDTLNQLVDEALQANHDLRMAVGRLVEARALRREAGFDLAPTVTAAGGYTRERLAAYKVPKIVEFRDVLPKSAVGKILRRVLVDEEKQKLGEGSR